MERRRDKERIKERLWRAYQASPELKRDLDEALLAISGVGGRDGRAAVGPGVPAGVLEDRLRRDQLPAVLRHQRAGGIKIETPEVFDNRNQKTLELVRSGKVTGLRIDHIDGLWDPECFLRRLPAKAGDIYVVVEKILGREEPMPREWPVAGTTGYEFLNALNGDLHRPARGSRRSRSRIGGLTGEPCRSRSSAIRQQAGHRGAVPRRPERAGASSGRARRAAPAGAGRAAVRAHGGADRGVRHACRCTGRISTISNLGERPRVYRAHRGAGAQPRHRRPDQRRGVRLHPLGAAARAAATTWKSGRRSGSRS